MRRVDTVRGKRLLELVILAREAWQFIDKEDDASWTFEYEGFTYVGCRLRTRRPVDENYVRLTFTWKESHGTVPPAAPGA